MKGRCNVYLVKVLVGIIEPWQDNQISLVQIESLIKKQEMAT